MNYYLICQKKRLYANCGAVSDFGPDIDERSIIDFVTKSMINNWKIEIIDESEMDKVDPTHRWTEYKKWM